VNNKRNKGKWRRRSKKRSKEYNTDPMTLALVIPKKCPGIISWTSSAFPSVTPERD